MISGTQAEYKELQKYPLSSSTLAGLSVIAAVAVSYGEDHTGKSEGG